MTPQQALDIINGSHYGRAIRALVKEATQIMHDLENTGIDLNEKDDKDITTQHKNGIDMLDKCLENIEKYRGKLKLPADIEEADKAISEIGKQAEAENFMRERQKLKNGG